MDNYCFINKNLFFFLNILQKHLYNDQISDIFLNKIGPLKLENAK